MNEPPDTGTPAAQPSTPTAGLRPPIGRRVTRALANLTLLLVAVAMSLVGGEYLTRWVYRGVTTTADFSGYFTTKWMRAEVRENRHGFRGAEFSTAKAEGVYRVVVIGDSFTWGNGVPEKARLSNILDAELRRRGVEVLNLGFPGNNWNEHVATLERKALPLKPDFVLLQWGVNDVELDRDVNRRPRVPPLITSREWHDAMHRSSALYTLLNQAWVRYQVTRDMGSAYDNYMRGLYTDPQSEGAVHAETQMRRFIAIAREHDVPVAIILFPDTNVPLRADYPYRFLHERVLATCKDEGIACIDMLPRFAVVQDPRTLWASLLDAHPSAKANRMAADEVLATVARTWGRPPASVTP